jgi:hypothetical protein
MPRPRRVKSWILPTPDSLRARPKVRSRKCPNRKLHLTVVVREKNKSQLNRRESLMR